MVCRYTNYSDAKLLNIKEVMTRTLTVEKRVLTESLHTVPVVHDMFTYHRFEWMARSVGPYSKEMV